MYSLYFHTVVLVGLFSIEVRHEGNMPGLIDSLIMWHNASRIGKKK